MHASETFCCFGSGCLPLGCALGLMACHLHAGRLCWPLRCFALRCVLKKKKKKNITAAGLALNTLSSCCNIEIRRFQRAASWPAFLPVEPSVSIVSMHESLSLHELHYTPHAGICARAVYISLYLRFTTVLRTSTTHPFHHRACSTPPLRRCCACCRMHSLTTIRN